LQKEEAAMLDEGNDFNLEPSGETPPEESSNRTFLIVGGIMAGVVFLTLICFAVYIFVISPRLKAQTTDQQSAVETQNAEQVLALTSTAEALLFTPTLPPTSVPTSTIIPDTPTNSPTPVVAVDTPTGTPTPDPATVAAMQTELAQNMTATAEATRGIGGEGMPATGFFDEVGLPSLIVLSVALVAVIFLARRLRKAPMK
jgi:ABC-type antimicrobial peptide transport system permease subunit